VPRPQAGRRTGASSDHRSRAATLGTARETAALEQLLDAARDEGHDGRHVLARVPSHGMKVDLASVHCEHAIQHERVEVDVEIEGATKR